MLTQQLTLRDLNCRESSIPSALGMVIAGSPGPGEHVGRRCRGRGPPGRRGITGWSRWDRAGARGGGEAVGAGSQPEVGEDGE